MNLAAEKRELIKWINSLENPFIIAELNKIRKRENFKFEKEWERGGPGEEIKKIPQIFLKHYLGKSKYYSSEKCYRFSE